MTVRFRLTLIALLSLVLTGLLGALASSYTYALITTPLRLWTLNSLMHAIVVFACVLGILGSIWHGVSALAALRLLPHNGKTYARLSSLRRQRWWAPLVRQAASGTLMLTLSTGSAFAATSTPADDDLGWVPGASATAFPANTSSPAPALTASDKPATLASNPDKNAPSRAQSRPSSTANYYTVTVKPGDNLWTLTRTELAKQTGSAPNAIAEATIAQAWQQVYALNTATIGSDPNLIHPGAVLKVPDLIQEKQP